MTDQPPTGVFVRLPLSEDQAHVFLKESSHTWDEYNGSSDAIACEGGLIAIGTLVIDDDAEIFDIVDAAYGNSDEKYIRQSDHMAKLAERDAEIARLRAKQALYDRVIQENGELKLAVARLQTQNEKEIGEVIEERDECQQVINDLYQAVMGDPPEWSNSFGYRDAVEDVVDYVHALRTKALKGPEA